MNHQLKTLYAAVIDNEIVCVDTNIAQFYESFKKIEPGIGHYRTFLKRFKPEPKKYIWRFQLTLSGKTYHFQKLV